jgi:hypothetical protein
MSMDKPGWHTVFLCGFLFMVSFFYANAILFVSIHEPNFGEEAYSDRGPYYWRVTGNFIQQNLVRSVLPVWIVALKVREPFYTELVYYPLLGGIMWFGYGCLIAWGHRTKRLAMVLALLAVLWGAFAYLERVTRIPTLF